jgi:hypothetical protein
VHCQWLLRYKVIRISIESGDQVSFDAPAEVTTTTEFVAPQVKCTAKVGDTGPGGGLVFIDASTAGNITGECFEAAPATWALPWGCENQNVEPTTSPEIGKGKENTVAMLDLCVREEVLLPLNAASFADQLRAGGKDDWFLPSKDELDLAYNNLAQNRDGGKDSPLGGFNKGYYWTSTDYNNTTAWMQYFMDGQQFDRVQTMATNVQPPSNPFRVRAIRSFG